MAGEHTGHRQRMRERFLTQGLDGFAPHETLELMLFYAIPQRNVNPLAHRLIERFGTFRAVLEAPAEELMKVEGMGEYAATLIRLFAAVSQRCVRKPEELLPRLSNRLEAEDHCVRLCHGLRQEHFFAVCLDGQMRVIRDALIARGTLNEVPAYPRLVAEAVLRHNAHAVLLCHNHPGGSVIPSAQDMEMTRRLGEMLDGLGVVLADHVIVADDECLSMVRYGLIQISTGQETIRADVADSAGEVRIRAKLEKQLKGKK